MGNLRETLSPKEREVYDRLREVKDPEFGFSILDANLVDEIRVEGGKAKVVFHLTMPFCPPPFALHIGREIKKKASEVPGIEEVEVEVRNHIMADEINKALRET